MSRNFPQKWFLRALVDQFPEHDYPLLLGPAVDCRSLEGAIPDQRREVWNPSLIGTSAGAQEGARFSIPIQLI